MSQNSPEWQEAQKKYELEKKNKDNQRKNSLNENQDPLAFLEKLVSKIMKWPAQDLKVLMEAGDTLFKNGARIILDSNVKSKTQEVATEKAQDISSAQR